MGGESEAAWRAMLDDLTSRGLGRPELVIVDGGKGLEAALASLWDDVPVQAAPAQGAHLLAHAPKHLHDEIKADFHHMMNAKAAAQVLVRRSVLGKLELRCLSVATSWNKLASAVDVRALTAEQWRSARTTNAIERLHEEFKRRIKMQCLLPCARLPPCCSGAVRRPVRSPCPGSNGWQTLERSPTRS